MSIKGPKIGRAAEQRASADRRVGEWRNEHGWERRAGGTFSTTPSGCAVTGCNRFKWSFPQLKRKRGARRSHRWQRSARPERGHHLHHALPSRSARIRGVRVQQFSVRLTSQQPRWAKLLRGHHRRRRRIHCQLSCIPRVSPPESGVEAGALAASVARSSDCHRRRFEEGRT